MYTRIVPFGWRYVFIFSISYVVYVLPLCKFFYKGKLKLTRVI
jgi:hypothetical protein